MSPPGLLHLLLALPLISADKNRSRRSLLFPQYTILQFTYGVSAPAILPKRSINLSVCLQVNFELPFNTTQFWPTVVSARSGGEYDINRETLYGYITELLDSVGLSGEQCLLRLICDVAEIPMHLETSDDLLEKIAHYLFTPSEDFVVANYTTNIIYESDKYLEAEFAGRNNRKCYEAFPDCSVSLIDYFTKIFRV